MGTEDADDVPGSGPLEGARARGTVTRMLLGSQLRRLREAAGITPDEAGYAIRASRSKISRMENGRVSFKGRDVTDLLTLYGVTDEQTREGIVRLAGQANVPGWWARYSDVVPDWFDMYVGLEAAASVIRTFEIQFVHGLFQTADYARAVAALGYPSATAAEIDRRVSLRLKRQDLLGAPNAPWIWAVMDEAALRRPVGSRKVMRAQLVRLAEVAMMPRVTFQVMPFGHGGHAAAGGSFTILRFAENDLPDVIYLEQLTSALYLEGHSDVEHYLGVMDRLSADALTPAKTVRFLTQMIPEI